MQNYGEFIKKFFKAFLLKIGPILAKIWPAEGPLFQINGFPHCQTPKIRWIWEYIDWGRLLIPIILWGIILFSSSMDLPACCVGETMREICLVFCQDLSGTSGSIRNLTI